MEWSGVRSEESALSGALAVPLGPLLPPTPYQRLRAGRRGKDGLGDAEVAANQRARLHRALLAILEEHGYAALRTRDLYEQAGISKRDFYRHYKGGVHDCFMASLAQITDALTERLSAAWLRADQPEESLTLAVAAFAQTIAEEPTAARLALCEPFAAGPCALEAMQAADMRLRAMLTASLAAYGVQPAPIAVRALLAGLGNLARACLLQGRQEELACHVAPLARWAYACLEAPQLPATGTTGAPLGYRPSEALLRSATDRRQPERARILAATAALAAERSRAAIDEPAIRRAAHLTCDQFHEHFADEHAAFIAVIEDMWGRTLRHAVAVARTASDWPKGLAHGVAALMNSLASDPVLARLTFAEMPAVRGSHGTRELMRLMSAAAGQLSKSTPLPIRPDTVVAEASIAASWTIAQDYVREGRQHELSELAPMICFIALAPAIGPRAAAQAIGAPGPSPLASARHASHRTASAQRPASSLEHTSRLSGQKIEIHPSAPRLS